MKVVPFEPLDPGMYRELVRRALAEDFGWGDVTTETIIDREQKARGVIVAKATCVIAGIDIAADAFRQHTSRSSARMDSAASAVPRWPRSAVRRRRCSRRSGRRSTSSSD